MPTLSEEDQEESSNEDSQEATPRSRADNDTRVENDVQAAPVRTSNSGLSLKRLTANGHSDDEWDDDDSLGPAFEDMLHQLRYDLSFLVLSISDLTVRNLVRVRDALVSIRGNHNGDQQQTREKPLTENMRLMRTVLAVDTLRLFMLRHHKDNVIVAVTSAVRRIFDQYVSDHGVGPLAHSLSVLTSRNIARAVLFTRDILEKQEREKQMRAGVEYKSSSPGKTRAHSPTYRQSPSGSPVRMASPTRSFSSGVSPTRSSTSGGGASSSSSFASPRRSILASDGTHVLMNEKLAAYKHRPDVDKIPSMKVCRDSAHVVAEAARRRQKSIHYGRESTRLLLEREPAS